MKNKNEDKIMDMLNIISQSDGCGVNYSTYLCVRSWTRLAEGGSNTG
jgi:hypothetical protein